MTRDFHRLAIAVAGITILLTLSGCGGAEARLARHMHKGQDFLAAGNVEKARVEFANALQISPTNAQARLQMGIVDEKLGKTREAAGFYQSVIDVSPDNRDARARLARLYLLSGAPEQALDLVNSALEKHPDDADLLTVRAGVRIQKHDSDGALRDALRAVLVAPENQDAVIVLAGIYKAQNEIEKAQTLLEQAVERMPSAVDLRLVLAQVYVQESRTADAEAQLRELVKLQPTSASPRVQLAQFYARQNEVDAAERTLREAVTDLPRDRDLKQSLVTFLAGRRGLDVAEKELTGMIAASPSDTELQFMLASLFVTGKEPAKAEAIYRRVIDQSGIEPPGLTARDRLAALRLDAHDLAGAGKLVGEVLAKSPRDDDALLIRGNIEVLNHDPRAAIADLRAVLRDQPNSIEVSRLLARAHLQNGEPAVAEETLRHAVELNPKDTALELEFAAFLAQIGKTEEAKTRLADLLKRSPADVDALNAQFRLAMSSKDLVTAKSVADALIALRPKDAVGYVFEGMVAEAAGHADEALRYATQAADLAPQTAEPLEAVVRLLVAAKRAPEALRRLDAVAAAYPRESFALTLKGELLLRSGQSAAALDAFQQAIARTPTWWAPYSDRASAELANKEAPAVVIARLRQAKAVVTQPNPIALRLASLFESAGKVDDAIKEYDEVLSRDPDSEVAANNLALLLVNAKTDAASLNRAKELSARFAKSTNLAYVDTYAWVLAKGGDAAQSVPLLAGVVQQAPNAVLARYHLGVAQALAGDSAAARASLTRVVNSGVQFSGLDDAKSVLQKLSKTPGTSAAPTG